MVPPARVAPEFFPMLPGSNPIISRGRMFFFLTSDVGTNLEPHGSCGVEGKADVSREAVSNEEPRRFLL